MDGLFLEWRKLQLIHDTIAQDGLEEEAKPLAAEAQAALDRSLAEISKAVGLASWQRSLVRDGAAQLLKARESLAEARRMVKAARQTAEQARQSRKRARRMRDDSHAQRQRIRRGRSEG
jgi:hypothetical protein